MKRLSFALGFLLLNVISFANPAAETPNTAEYCMCKLYVPNVFSPNNDGKNAELFVRGFAEVEIFQVYNRWGEMVFQTTDGTAGWDGTHKGEPLNTDVFIYYIEAICPDTGGRLMKTGDVTLLR